jgi:hypothetical protein
MCWCISNRSELRRGQNSEMRTALTVQFYFSKVKEWLVEEDGVADGIRTRNNKLHKLGLYH